LIAFLPSLIHCSAVPRWRLPHEVRRYYASFTYQAQSWVGNEEADARVELARMPFDLGHDAARLAP
jgi:hypothetical protein